MKILVIDDDIGMTDLMTILLSPASSEIITANTASEGIRLLKQYSPDVVILDYQIPEGDGWGVCRKIRDLSEVPILVLSAIDSPGLIADALDNGADDYLIKPVSSGSLIARLHKLVRRPNLASKNSLQPKPTV